MKVKKLYVALPSLLLLILFTQNLLLRYEIDSMGYTQVTLGVYEQSFVSDDGEIIENTVYINFFTPDVLQITYSNQDIITERLKLSFMY